MLKCLMILGWAVLWACRKASITYSFVVVGRDTGSIVLDLDGLQSVVLEADICRGSLSTRSRG